MSKKEKQAYLSDEMKPEIPQEVETAAEALFDYRSRRIELTKEEDESQRVLVEVLKKHKLTTCRVGNLLVTLEEGKCKAKVKPVGEDQQKNEQE